MVQSMRVLAWGLLLLWLPPLKGQPSAPRIVIDGNFDDWAGIPQAVVRPSSKPLAGFREVRLTHDASAIYFLVDFDRIFSVTEAADETCQILLDADGRADTGSTERQLSGVDLVLELSPANSQGIVVRSNRPGAGKLTAYDIGFLSQPTYAAQRFEIRLDRRPQASRASPRFEGQRFKAKLVLLNSSGAVIGETENLTHELSPLARTAPARNKPPREDPLRRPPGESLRVLNWNVSGRSLLDRPDRFLRILAALEPDLVLFDELSRDATAAEMEKFFSRLPASASARPWHIALGTSGGRQRCLIAARHPVAPAKALEWVEYPTKEREEILRETGDSGARQQLEKIFAEGVAAAGAQIEIGKNRLLAVSVDLSCCATRPGGREDHIRQMEVAAIHAAVRRAMADYPPSALVLGGDFNLVGLRGPLDAMRAGLDLDGSALAFGTPLRLDGISSVTWFQRGSRFPPARLDYLLYSDSSLSVAKTFVFNSRDLAERWRLSHNLKVEDSEAASDHFPMVTDFQWSRPAGP